MGIPLQKMFGTRDVVESSRYVPLHELVPAVSRLEAQEILRRGVAENQPFLAGRFGSTELKAVVRHVARSNRTAAQKLFALLSRGELPCWANSQFRDLSVKSGFFPISNVSVSEFSTKLLRAANEVNLLGSWVPGENQIHQHLSQAIITDLFSLEPFFSENPWTAALEGKKVLVIHPFSESIEAQYLRRERLFENPMVLPPFELKTLKAVQSLGGKETGYEDWFHALDAMNAAASEIEFDVALIGAGAYGLPLAAELKLAGKVAIHLGGVLQILFGISGRRWDTRPHYASLKNENWIYPLEVERPRGWRGADQGAYWR